MITPDYKVISNLIRDQFPAFYHEQGENFELFVQLYYEWLEETGFTTDLRSLLEYRDIDQTPDRFLEHFKNEYMRDLPDEILGNQRLFQKHILELYRSKGSDAAYKLLFRLLFNEDIDVYVPSYDIFTTSDGVWIQPRYIEVSYSAYFERFENKTVIGFTSGATATVEYIETKWINNRPVYLINVSNIRGTFVAGELIYYEGIPELSASPVIIGSPIEVDVLTSSAGFKTGDIVVDTKFDTADHAKPLYAVVSETYNSVGIINFSIIDGGDYYSVDAEVEITAGANTSGHGADFVVHEIDKQADFTYSEEKIAPYADIPLNATAYGFDFNPLANVETIIIQSVKMMTIPVGRIKTLAVTNQGTGYDDYVNVKVTDPYTSTASIWIDRTQSWGGTNANITGESITGDGLVSKARIYDSGYGYNHNQTVGFRGTDNPVLRLMGEVKIGGVGQGQGYFDDTKSFASADKYLFDGRYYQYFSYVIKTSKALDKFADILKQTIHPAGNAMFSLTKLAKDKSFKVEFEHTLTQEPI